MDKILNTMKTLKLLLITSMLILGQNYLFGQENWQYLDGLSDQYLWKVYAQSPDTVYITGASSRYDGQGMIAKSINGGANWIKTFTTTNTLLNDIAFYDKNTGFVVGEKGVILKTTNSGADWIFKTSGTIQNLNAIALTDLSNIWVVGNTGVVLHSIDEGETWEIVDLQMTTKLNDIAFKKDTGYFVGNSGIIYKTMNAGELWNKEIISDNIVDPFQDCKSLSLTDNNIYILCGYSTGYDLVTKRNSTAWQTNRCVATGFAFVNDSVGYSVYQDITTGGSGKIFSVLNTINSGKSWSVVYDNSVSPLYIDHSDISIVNDTVKYIVSGSVILKSTPSTPITVLNEKLADRGISVYQSSSQNELIVKSNSQPISAIQLFNSSGYNISNKRTISKATETLVDISKIPIGVYLLKITLSNNIQYVYKYIKN